MQFLPVTDPRSFTIPMLGSASVIIILLILFSTHWMDSEPVITKLPSHIKARLIQLQKKPAQKTNVLKKKSIKKPTAKKNAIKKVIVSNKINVKKPIKKIVKKETKKEKPKPLPLPGADLNLAMFEEEQQNDLSALLESELLVNKASKDQEAVTNHISQIIQMIQSVWRFPPSAKHDQVVLLRVFLVPTGEVTEVQLLESSGNSALDRSAEMAVWKVARFSVPDDAVLFEKEFRHIVLKLQPENARL